MRLGWVTLLGLATASCLPAGGFSTNNYGAALAATAVMVAAVGVHRARTGDCWGHCGPGLACDSASGLCVRGECDPACGNGETCQMLSVGPTCGPDPAIGLQVAVLRPGPSGSAATSTLPPFTPLPPLAPLFPVAPTPSTPPLAPLSPAGGPSTGQ